MKSGWRWGFAALAFVLASGAGAPDHVLAQQSNFAAAQKRFQELYDAGKFTEALAEAEKTEAAAKRAGTNNLAYVLALNDLGRANQGVGQYGKAAGMFAQVLATFEKNVSPTDPRLGQILANLATAVLLQGKSTEAEKFYKRALDIAIKAEGPESRSVAVLTGNLGDVYKSQARYEEAEAQYKRALAMAEKLGGPDSLQVALILNNLTKVYEEQSRFADVEDAAKRALAIREKRLGPDHSDVAASLNNLAHLYERTGKYAEANELFQRAIGIWEKALGPKHPYVATALLNLASVYSDEDRLDDAEALYKRALDIREAAFGRNNLEVATVLNNLAQIYEVQGRYDDVEIYSRRALPIVTKVLGADNPDTAKVMRKLGVAYDAKGRYGEAEAQFKSALDIFTKAFGPEHRYLAGVLINQGHMFEHQRRYDDAERVYRRALAINEKTRGANHPETARVLNDLALLNSIRGDRQGALSYSRKATAAILSHADLDESEVRQAREVGGLIEQRASFFINHVANLAAASQSGPGSDPALAREAFEIAQWANQSAAAAAVQQLGPRFGAGNSSLSALVRQDQDLSAFWRDRDKALVDALSKPASPATTAQVETIRGQIADTARKLAETRDKLHKNFPEYTALASPKPLKVEEVQKLLGGYEALVFLLPGENESYVFAVTDKTSAFQRIPVGRVELAAKVATFRRGLELDTMTLFDLNTANALYDLLLGPVDTLIRDKGNLIVAPSGSLTALPFHLLVTAKPQTAGSQGKPDASTAYRDAAWLIKRQAVSILPSVASLQALRSVAQANRAAKPMIGYGDPVFGQRPAQEKENRGSKSRGVVRAYSDYWRGAGLDRNMLMHALPPLPDTADELNAIAKTLNVPGSDIHLGRDASVTAVKHANLADYRIVYFATHGLVAGDIKGVAEPALALSVPDKPSNEDDGLLKAGDVAQLKLNADWVVLSACNTMAGEKPGAEALSGLARAFFYAGARALLVSHWAVASDAATRLTTNAFSTLRTNPTLGRAEAMRRTMLAYLADTSSPDNAYPAVWGPFAVIGEGDVR